MCIRDRDIREGLTAIISVKIEDPQFEGQTKQKLGNSEARAAVDNIVSEQLTYFLEQNPVVAKSMCEKSILAQSCLLYTSGNIRITTRIDRFAQQRHTCHDCRINHLKTQTYICSSQPVSYTHLPYPC